MTTKYKHNTGSKATTSQICQKTNMRYKKR